MAATLVIAIWSRQRPTHTDAMSAREATRAIRVIRRLDKTVGVAPREARIAVPATVREVLDALGVDDLPAAPCPPDYSLADVTLLLAGADVYAKRAAHVFDLDGPSPRVLAVNTSGCREGPLEDPPRLRRLLERVVGDRDSARHLGAPIGVLAARQQLLRE